MNLNLCRHEVWGDQNEILQPRPGQGLNCWPVSDLIGLLKIVLLSWGPGPNDDYDDGIVGDQNELLPPGIQVLAIGPEL